MSMKNGSLTSSDGGGGHPRPCKLLFLLSNFLPGGAERQYFNLIHGIDKKKFEVHIGLIQYRASRPTPEFLASLNSNRVDLFERRFLLDVSVIWKVARYAARNRIDLIQSLLFMDNQIARLAGLLCRKPVISSIRGEPLPLLDPVKFWFEFQMQPLSTRVVVNSRWLKDNLLHYGSRANKVKVIHNGTNAAKFQCDSDPRAMRLKYGLPEEGPIIGIVARLHPMKDHRNFFDTIHILKKKWPQVHAVVAGDGALREELKEYVNKLALEPNVTFLGSVTAGLEEVYRTMDVFLLTSQYGESFPNVILEAMSAAVPVVATHISAIPEIIVDGYNGFLVEKRNPEALAERTLQLLANQALRDMFIRHGLERIRKFEVEAMVKKYEQFYNAISTRS
jgi:glycosyltransferase involved in cell wall biosynthesis